jgi:hypothetical protein
VWGGIFIFERGGIRKGEKKDSFYIIYPPPPRESYYFL